MGGEDEGFCYAWRYEKSWKKVSGAINWLKEQTGIKIITKVGRNDLCPCGSGKKYKKCCGAYYLEIKRRRFCQLVKKYRNNTDSFSIKYKRNNATRKISKDIEDNIVKEVKYGEDAKLLMEQKYLLY